MLEQWIIVLRTCACACIDTFGFSSLSGFQAFPWGVHMEIITKLASGSTFVLSKELYFMQAKKDKRRERHTQSERESIETRKGMNGGGSKKKNTESEREAYRSL